MPNPSNRRRGTPATGPADARDLEQIQQAWTDLGAADPLWAVLVAPGKQNGGWDTDEFFAVGRREVDEALRNLERFGGTPPQTKTALDFGCGVGRLSQALAHHYDEVIGVDIAETMLDAARRLDRSDGRCRFVHNDAADLSFVDDDSVDLVFTSLVLQHMPTDIAESYVREFGRIVRPGGAVIVLVPTETKLTVQGALFRWAPRRVVELLQTRVRKYPAPMQMHTFPDDRMRAVLGERGLRVVGTTDEPEHGPHWRFTRYFATKPAAG